MERLARVFHVCCKVKSLAFLLGNEVDQWYICLEVCLGNSGLKKMEFTAIKDEVAEFLTKTERRKSKNTQNILLDGCYLLFEEYLHGRKHRFYILHCAEK